MNQQTKPRTDAHRAADRRYNAKRATKNITCALPSELAERFREKCAKNGDRMNAVLTAAVESYVNR